MAQLRRPWPFFFGVLFVVLVLGFAVWAGFPSTAHSDSGCKYGSGRGWETGYDDMRLQCFDTTKHGGPGTIWCVTAYRNGNASVSCVPGRKWNG